MIDWTCRPRAPKSCTLVDQLRARSDRLRSLEVEGGFSGRLLLAICAWVGLVLAAIWELWPMLRDATTYGFHDWDSAAAQRYLTTITLVKYHELPWWHPWFCGGFPAFGFAEGAPNLVSPFLPFYLLTDVRIALRAEVLLSTLIGLAGTYVLGGRFTSSPGLRALVAGLAFLNGRWTLQAAAGHAWHLVFCWMPWVLWFFDTALEPKRLRRAVYAGALLALMIYGGGVYPLPYTALALVVYALLWGLLARQLRSLMALAITGVVALGLGAPKLFAIVDTMGRVPRLIESREVIGLAELWVMLTDRTQKFGSRPIPVPAYNWHEWGIYVGSAGVALLALGLLFGNGARQNAFRLLGLLYLILGFGAFAPEAPWARLHRVPPFSSLHVPSRFHFPMVLFFGLSFAGWVAPALARWVHRWRGIDACLLLLAALITQDVVSVAQRPMGQAFWMDAPAHIESRDLFEHTTQPVVTYLRPDWAPPVLLPMMANTGVIRCYGVPLSFQPGALAKDARDYQGPAWISRGGGTARLLDWSPNRANIEVTGATPGSLLVYNMNWDPSWRADGQPALAYRNTVAAELAGGSAKVEFSYQPRTLGVSMTVCLLTLAAILGWGGPRWRRRPRVSREASSSSLSVSERFAEQATASRKASRTDP